MKKKPLACKASQRRLLLSFRASVPETTGNAHYREQLEMRISELVKELKNEFPRPTFYFQVDGDAAFNRHLSDSLAEHGTAFIADPVTTRTLEAIYGTASIVVSNRLHCLLFGARYGALPLALTSSSHTKVVSLYETHGWERLLLDIDNNLKSPLADILTGQAELSRMIDGTFSRSSALCFRRLQTLFSQDLSDCRISNKTQGAWDLPNPSGRHRIRVGVNRGNTLEEL